MANLKEIRNRITSVGSTMQITTAMKLVSAAKLKKAQDGITQFRPYSQKMQEILQNISANIEPEVIGEYTKTNESDTILLVALTSNKGLIGGFNANIIKEVTRLRKETNKKVEVLTIGKKAFDILKKHEGFYKNESELWNDLSPENVYRIADSLVQDFKEKKFSEIYLVYNQFKNAATQFVIKEQFLPLEIKPQISKTQTDYIYEPQKEKILLDLIPKTLRAQLFKAALDSLAAEHGARMTAMHKATDNADELRKALVINYNKARQASITTEILEIVGGAEALNG